MTRRLLVLALAGVLTALTGLPICDAVFDCGCTWIFAGADSHCDIHRPGPPDCPPCANWFIGAPFFGAILAAWAGLASLVIRRRRAAPNGSGLPVPGPPHQPGPR